MRIGLIHATRLAIDPVADAFARHWPDADTMNLLDDSLSRDRAKTEHLTNALADRIAKLAAYATGAGCDGILYTCSAFGPAIDDVARKSAIPVLTPTAAMYADAVASGGGIGLLASFEPSVGSMASEFASNHGDHALTARCVPSALTALQAGDGETHDRLLADAAKQMTDCQVIMLAQFSTARAADAVTKATGKTVLTSPGSAVKAMKARLG